MGKLVLGSTARARRRRPGARTQLYAVATLVLVSAACSDDATTDTGGAGDASGSAADAAFVDRPPGAPDDAGGGTGRAADAAGEDAASVDAATAADAGSPDAGGPDAGGPDAGDAGAVPDATPPEIDRTRLVPTSGKHVLFSRVPPGQSFAVELFALDLEDGGLHDMNPDGPLGSGASVSPSGGRGVLGSAGAARSR
jgi:hypothetical protein